MCFTVENNLTYFHFVLQVANKLPSKPQKLNKGGNP
jgi:hypothetical protein